MIKINTLNRAANFLKYILLAYAALYFITYLLIVFFRIQYPFELEWLEGVSVDHVLRILYGQKLYVEPSINFVPYLYTPFYFYLSALISKIIGIGFTPLRLVSFISSLGCFYMIFLIVKKETNNKMSGFLSLGLFAATFRIGGAWLDIARTDSLFLLLLLITIYLIRFNTSLFSSILAGLFVSLSFLTKQTAMLIFLPIIFFVALINRRRSILLIGTAAIVIGISTLILDIIHDGWYSYYVFELPRSFYSIVKERIISFWVEDILLALPVACLAAIFYLFMSNKDVSKILIIKKKGINKSSLFYILVSTGMFAGAYSTRLYAGGYNNVLLPAYAIISILFGLGMHKALEKYQVDNAKNRIITISIYIICIIQFSLLIYNPINQVPGKKDLEAGNKLLNMLKQIEGEIFVPFHGYLSTLAGKKIYVQSMAFGDICKSKKEKIRIKFSNDFIQAIREKRFSAIVYDKQRLIYSDMEKYYKKHRVIFDSNNVFWPVTGCRTRPEFIYIPRTDNLESFSASKGNTEKEIEEYKELIKLNPTVARLNNELGIIYLNNGLFDEAIKLFRETIKLEQDNTDAHNNLGIIYGNKGLHDKAIECFQETIRIDPEHKSAYKNIGLVYKMMGDHKNTVFYWQKYLKKNPAAEDKNTILLEINKLKYNK